MNIAIVIPSRIGSTRLPNKALAMIGPQAMVAHVVDRAKETGITNIIVATDSDQISDAISKKNVTCIMTDPNHPSGSDRIFETLTKFDPENKIEYVLNLQGDVPFVNPHDLLKLIEAIEESEYDAVTLATVIKDQNSINDPNIVKLVMDTNGKALYFSRLPIPYNGQKFYEHIGVYAYKRTSLKRFVELPVSMLEASEKLEQLRMLENGMSIGVRLTDTPPVNVDTEESLERARKQFTLQLSSQKHDKY